MRVMKKQLMKIIPLLLVQLEDWLGWKNVEADLQEHLTHRSYEYQIVRTMK
jgi:hypothetical protein